MYARIARFDGGERNWEEFAATLARRFAAADTALRLRTWLAQPSG